MEVKIDVKGLKELEKRIREISKEVGPDKVEPVLMKAGRDLAKEIRRNAPVGPTGNLKRSIKTKKLKRIGNTPATVITAVDRKIAPHAHLVEFGTQGPRVPKKAKVMYDKEEKKFYGKEVGPMPANPFFRRTVDTQMPRIAKQVLRDLEGLVKEAFKK